MKKVIVTGGAGFVGHHLVNNLLGHGYHVVVLDDMSNGRHVNRKAEFYQADVSIVHTCKHFFKGADMVFNLAATVAGVEYNKYHNAQMFQKNINTLVSPVIAAQEVGVPHFLQVSSVCIYDPSNQDMPDESIGYEGRPHIANGGYGQAKRDGEYAALFWSNLEHVVVARPSNMFGPGDDFDPDKAHVIPALINRIHATKNGDTLEVYGRPDIVREFLYVEDCAEAMIHLLENTTGREAYNVGTGGQTAVTIGELVETLLQVMGKELQVSWSSDKGGGDDKRRSNTAKVEATGWKYKTDLQTGLKKTMEWYNANIKSV